MRRAGGGELSRGKLANRSVPSPFSSSGMGATFLVCSMVACPGLVNDAAPEVVIGNKKTHVSRGAVDGVLAGLNGTVV